MAVRSPFSSSSSCVDAGPCSMLHTVHAKTIPHTFMRLTMLFWWLVLGIIPVSLYGRGIGGTFLALGGRDCVVIATDSRYSGPRAGGLFLSQHPRKVYKVGDHTLMGFHGLESDADSLARSLHKVFKRYELDRSDLLPNHVSKIVSMMLYAGTINAVPIIAGISADGSPYICSMDGIGARTESNSYAATGTSAPGLLAICESYYRRDLSSTELTDLAEQCLRLSFQRDALSGGGRMKIVTLARRPRSTRNGDDLRRPTSKALFEENGVIDVHPLLDIGDEKDDEVAIFTKTVEVGES